MVVVEYTYEDMKRLIDLPREKLIASLSDLGAPSEYEAETGKIVTELTPNRPDWYSMEGLARALRAYHGKGSPSYKVRKSDYAVKVDPSVARIRPFTVCAVIKGLSLDDQRIRDLVLLQEKLLGTLGRKVKKFALGLYPLQAIRFPLRYTAMKPEEIRFIPLGHERVMGADEILREHKKGQQYGHLLQGLERYPVYMDADGRIMSLIPIVNSAETGKVDTGTRDIFIEVSGMDRNACTAALNILCCTLADMGGSVHEVRVDSGKERLASPDLEPRKVRFDLENANRMLGLEITQKQAAAHLERMGYAYSKGYVFVPAYRADVLGQVDIIEDIAISYGYNNFVPTIPDFFNPGSAQRDYDEADEIMRGMGFMETKTFVLTNKEKLSQSGHDSGVMEISNPGTADYTVIRPSLVPDMIETFSINKMKGLPQRFYEIGLVQKGGRSVKRLVFGAMDRGLGFSEFRGFLQTLMKERGLALELRKKPAKAFTAETSCVVLAGGKEIGMLGQVSKDVLEKRGISFDVFICELEL